MKSGANVIVTVLAQGSGPTVSCTTAGSAGTAVVLTIVVGRVGAEVDWLVLAGVADM